MAEWRSIFEDEPTNSAVRKDKISGWFVVSLVPTAVCLEKINRNQLSLELGEMAYQLRSALDGLIWDAITYKRGAEPPLDENRLEFPIRRVETFEKCELHKYPLPNQLTDWLKSIQLGATEKPIGDPHRGLANALEDIHNLARFDRHRRLRVVAAIPTNYILEVQTDPVGGGIDAEDWLDCDLFNSKYDVVRLKVSIAKVMTPSKVRFESNFRFTPLVEDLVMYEGDTNIGDQLTRLHSAVTRVIERFEMEFN